jgi:ubiquinone/menaquinone biosynthesis C-methylase UbiE
MLDTQAMRSSNRRTYLEVGGIYDTLLAYRTADLPFWERVAVAGEGAFVEVGCGTGRILAAVAKRGVPVCGIDSSSQMLDVCDRNLRSIPGADFTLVHADFETLTAFPVEPAVVAFTLGSFQYCLDGHLAVLERFRRAMPTGAQLILDAKNFYADPKFTSGLHQISPGRASEILAEPYKLTVVEEVRFEPLEHIVQETARYWIQKPEPRHEIVIDQYMRSFTVHELRLLMKAAGFEPMEVWRNYDLTDASAAPSTGQRVIVSGRAV